MSGKTGYELMGDFKYYDTRSAADILGIGKSTLDKMRLTGEGPEYSKVGRRVIYSLADIHAWLDGRKRRSTSDQRAA